jgi:hypothetical protein
VDDPSSVSSCRGSAKAGGQLYGEPHTWCLPAFAKWEIRVRSGPNEQTSKIEGQRGRLDSQLSGRTADPSTPLRSGRDDKGSGVTHLERCYSDGESLKTCSFLPALASGKSFARGDKVVKQRSSVSLEWKIKPQVNEDPPSLRSGKALF